jgi:phosphoribosylglycinamide formyltransferase-1
MPAEAHAHQPAVVLISGRGSNLQAILDRIDAGELPVTVRAVVSDRAGAAGLARARAARIPAIALSPEEHPVPGEYDRALAALIARHSPTLVVLAGFMRILGPEVLEAYRGRLLNIHPSLLPKYRGLHTHRRALAAGERVHGCSVHFVTAELDGGPVIAQAEVPVRKDDDETSLRVRVQGREHVIYPRVIGWFAAGRLRLTEQGVQFDGAPLAVPKIFPWDEGEKT